MKRFAWVVAAVALAGPAAAETKAVALDDGQLDQVAAGCGDHGSTPAGTTGGTLAPVGNVNVSPIIVNQTAVAFNMQTAKIGKVGKHGKAHQNQSATALALNTVNINYHPKF